MTFLTVLSGFPQLCAKYGFLTYSVTELSKAQYSGGWRGSDLTMFARQQCTTCPPGSVLRARGACGQQVGAVTGCLGCHSQGTTWDGQTALGGECGQREGFPLPATVWICLPFVRSDIPLYVTFFLLKKYKLGNPVDCRSILYNLQLSAKIHWLIFDIIFALG